jgi:hypothetical protein
MTASRRFRFGVELHEPLPGRSWADSVREVEASGYSTMFVPDHCSWQHLEPVFSATRRDDDTPGVRDFRSTPPSHVGEWQRST